MAIKRVTEIPTIDVVLVMVENADKTKQFILDTASTIEVEPQINEEEAVQLVVKGMLKAQKPAVNTITGNQITLTDNVFSPELVQMLQGGTIKYWTDGDHDEETTTETEFGVSSYAPPVAGSSEKGEVFTLKAYSAQYDAAGLLVQYECISYPNCQGVPVAFNSEDGAFRAPEYTINSAPKTGEPPYVISYTDTLPTEVKTLGTLTVQSAAGTSTGHTKLTVTPTLSYGNKYKIKTGSTTLPQYDEDLSSGGWLDWNGTDEVAATNGSQLVVAECTVADNKARKAGAVTSVNAME